MPWIEMSISIKMLRTDSLYVVTFAMNNIRSIYIFMLQAQVRDRVIFRQ